jgi:hypothetical protein
VAVVVEVAERHVPGLAGVTDVRYRGQLLLRLEVPVLVVQEQPEPVDPVAVGRAVAVVVGDDGREVVPHEQVGGLVPVDVSERHGAAAREIALGVPRHPARRDVVERREERERVRQRRVPAAVVHHPEVRGPRLVSLGGESQVPVVDDGERSRDRPVPQEHPGDAVQPLAEHVDQGASIFGSLDRRDARDRGAGREVVERGLARVQLPVRIDHRHGHRPFALGDRDAQLVRGDEHALRLRVVEEDLGDILGLRALRELDAHQAHDIVLAPLRGVDAEQDRLVPAQVELPLPGLRELHLERRGEERGRGRVPHPDREVAEAAHQVDLGLQCRALRLEAGDRAGHGSALRIEHGQNLEAVCRLRLDLRLQDPVGGAAHDEVVRLARAERHVLELHRLGRFALGLDLVVAHLAVLREHSEQVASRGRDGELLQGRALLLGLERPRDVERLPVRAEELEIGVEAAALLRRDGDAQLGLRERVEHEVVRVVRRVDRGGDPIPRIHEHPAVRGEGRRREEREGGDEGNAERRSPGEPMDHRDVSWQPEFVRPKLNSYRSLSRFSVKAYTPGEFHVQGLSIRCIVWMFVG